MKGTIKEAKIWVAFGTCVRIIEILNLIIEERDELKAWFIRDWKRSGKHDIFTREQLDDNTLHAFSNFKESFIYPIIYFLNKLVKASSIFVF